ncbi:hypothetical protein ABMC89_03970 [Sulfitobacter sp. HNIBRBA3233]|uniref:hypothetical protein n=1 Tax=Sulfitobacter marinivivus TaxID=3158558 RepID=UPI0032DEEACC
MIAQVAKETAIAVVLFFLVSLLFNFGGDTITEKLTGTVLFGVIYALLGLVIKWVRSRNS